MATSEIIEKENCRRVVKVEVSAEEVKAEFDRAYKGFIKDASVPGFRKGKVPLAIIKTRYGEHVKEEVMRKLISSSFYDIIKEKNLEILSEPLIEEVQLKPEEPFSYKAGFEVRPEIKLGDYNKLKLTKKIKKITREDIDNSLKDIQERFAKNKTNPIDDELAKDIGFDNLEKLKEDIQKRLEVSEEERVYHELIRQIDERILSIGELAPPESAVKRREEFLLEEMRHGFEQQGKKDEYKTREEEFRKGAREGSLRRVKLAYLLDEVGRRENIKVNEEEVEADLKGMFGDNKEGIRKARDRLIKEKTWENYSLRIRERKIYQYLIDKAEIVEDGSRRL